MMEILSTLAEDTCRNCGQEIHLVSGDLSRDPWWSHLPSPRGSGRRECAGAPVAEPAHDDRYLDAVPSPHSRSPVPQHPAGKVNET